MEDSTNGKRMPTTKKNRATLVRMSPREREMLASLVESTGYTASHILREGMRMFHTKHRRAGASATKAEG